MISVIAREQQGGGAAAEMLSWEEKAWGLAIYREGKTEERSSNGKEIVPFHLTGPRRVRTVGIRRKFHF
ncbi:hypothetical protein MA16_Dca003026 [Dendrobium catenatum]|uniref:Uncharacterized protein n=1 Tax=Dendrobium catenatum TaxID=906689 RepID=A0A2I0X9C6_9ASPA|nr:hypothetical protein MA16_Dca003026 [Dendrobium catenatum]